MESAHQLSFRPDCSNTTEIPYFTLRTALSAIPLVSDRCGVDVQWFQKDLHKLFRILGNCQCKWLLASSRVPGTFASCAGFLVKFCFCTDTSGSIEWLDPAPRLRNDDCFEIRNCRWRPCGLLLSSHRSCQHEVRLRLCVSCTEPL